MRTIYKTLTTLGVVSILGFGPAQAQLFPYGGAVKAAPATSQAAPGKAAAGIEVFPFSAVSSPLVAAPSGSSRPPSGDYAQPQGFTALASDLRPTPLAPEGDRVLTAQARPSLPASMQRR